MAKLVSWIWQFIVEINNSFYSVISENIADSFITEKKKLFFSTQYI